MDQQFVDTVNQIKVSRANQLGGGEQDLLDAFSGYYSQLSQFNDATFNDQNLAVIARTILINVKAVVQVKALLKDGQDLAAADLVLVTAFNDALNLVP